MNRKTEKDIQEVEEEVHKRTSVSSTRLLEGAKYKFQV